MLLQMSSLWALVWLICGFSILCESATCNAATTKVCHYRKAFMGLEYDVREAVLCENRLHPGTGLSCCGPKTFNRAAATCCGHGHTANITHGLSERVSACCGLVAYSALNEICCNSTVMAKPGPKAKCCGKEAYDEDKQLCCGTNKTILTRQSIHHRCCGHDQFDMKTQCCCTVNYTLQIKPVPSKCCQQDSEPNNEAKPKARCGGEKEYNMDKQLCCGPVNNKTILTKQSIHHLCCGHDQYDKKTQCCCTVNGMLKVEPICSSCCLNESGVQQQKPTPHLNCTEPNTSRCGLSCYNPNESACCERKQTEPYWHCNGQGQCNVTATVYNPHTHVCCDGCVSPWKPWIDHNHVIERMWSEVNSRVNYPLKTALVELVDEEQLDMEDDTSKYCVSNLTCQMPKIGITNVVEAWNAHRIPGKGIPDDLAKEGCPAKPEDDVVPIGAIAAELYHQHVGSALKRESVFGSNPFSSEEAQQRTEKEFNSHFDTLSLYQNVIHQNYSPFKDAIKSLIDLTRRYM